MGPGTDNQQADFHDVGQLGHHPVTAARLVDFEQLGKMRHHRDQLQRADPQGPATICLQRDPSERQQCPQIDHEVSGIDLEPCRVSKNEMVGGVKQQHRHDHDRHQPFRLVALADGKQRGQAQQEPG